MDELHSHSILSYVGWRSKGDATYQKTGGRASVRAPVAVKLPSLTPHRKFGGNTLVAEMKTAEKDDDISAVILKPKFFFCLVHFSCTSTQAASDGTLTLEPLARSCSWSAFTNPSRRK